MTNVPHSQSGQCLAYHRQGGCVFDGHHILQQVGPQHLYSTHTYHSSAYTSCKQAMNTHRTTLHRTTLQGTAGNTNLQHNRAQQNNTYQQKRKQKTTSSEPAVGSYSNFARSHPIPAFGHCWHVILVLRPLLGNNAKKGGPFCAFALCAFCCLCCGDKQLSSLFQHVAAPSNSCGCIAA